MKKLFFLVILIVLMLVFTACNDENNENNENNDGHRETAGEFLQLVTSEEFDEAVSYFDETMSDGLSSAELSEIWDLLLIQAGAFIDYEYNRTEEIDDLKRVVYTGLFEATEVTFLVVVDEDQKVAGFFIQ
ncbi:MULTISPECIES: DUF3887 domain-containing protein [Bacillaceae]|uniref:DUF3887 domain-containing protein n=1 Tax=Evansella alkalicola TaxID=745819 RepID=A0ABS6JTY3_9BACI|nr:MULTISPECIES: DUF3887 domain-containing protein [Bacillaceae]MBU9722048.1 DUF3887 domain-containing protein [Bacillus alkalicola]